MLVRVTPAHYQAELDKLAAAILQAQIGLIAADALLRECAEAAARAEQVGQEPLAGWLSEVRRQVRGVVERLMEVTEP